MVVVAMIPRQAGAQIRHGGNGRRKCPPVTKDVLRSLFHLSRADAAWRLRMGGTHFKRKCRENGIETWPGSKSKPAPSLRSVAQWVGDCLQER